MFVGLVTNTHGYQATVKVEMVWRGDVPLTVHVSGRPNPAPKTAQGEGWQKFTAGKRYLFLADDLRDKTAYISGCSGTRLFTNHLSTLQPPKTHGPG
ncbi:MAG: hypothetical protein ACRDQA_22740 [Nocardioidaceae bacterium]